MELLCGGCGKTLTVADDLAGGETTCAHCGRKIRIPSLGTPEEGERDDLHRLQAEEDFDDEFLTKAKLSLRKKMLVTCGSCGERLTVPQRLAGKVRHCVACGGQIRIPSLTYEEPLIRDRPDEEALDVVPDDEALPAVVPAALVAQPYRAKRRLVVVLALTAVALCGAVGVLAYVLSSRKGAETPAEKPGKLPVVDPGPLKQPPLNPIDTSNAPAEPTATVLAGRLTVLAGRGAVPAPLTEAFAEIRVRITAGRSGPLRIDSAGGAVLDIVKDKLPALGVAEPDGAVPLAARPILLEIPPGRSLDVTLVFIVPQNLAVGILQIDGVGVVPLPPLPKLHTPAATALAGTYLEAGRRLKFDFDDPLMESLRSGPGRQMKIKAAGDAFEVALRPGGPSGRARHVSDGVYAVRLTDGENELPCHLRLIEKGAKLILYLAQDPYHQIIYQRK